MDGCVGTSNYSKGTNNIWRYKGVEVVENRYHPYPVGTHYIKEKKRKEMSKSRENKESVKERIKNAKYF